MAGQYFRIAALAVLVSTILVGFVLSGQGIEDMVSYVLDVLFQIPDLQWQDLFNALREVSWYHWNPTNKKIYLIFLTNSSRVYKIKYTENISLNHKLGLQV